MGKINWGRVFLSGLLMGVVFGALMTPVMLFLGQDFLEATPVGNPLSPFKSGLMLFFAAMWFAGGIWTMWLYAAIRPRYGPGPKTAAIAGLAAAIFGALADVVWTSFGFVSWEVIVVPVACAMAVLVVAAVVGAWAYKE